MEAAFFVMGGYTVITESNHSDNSAIITPQGSLLLAKHGMIDPGLLDKEVIKDKSKTDVLTKLLVCVQALWMLVECIARKASGLPITLLELNVAMHVVCAIVMYGFWWRKPLEVNQPICLELGAEDIAFLRCMSKIPRNASFLIFPELSSPTDPQEDPTKCPEAHTPNDLLMFKPEYGGLVELLLGNISGMEMTR